MILHCSFLDSRPSPLEATHLEMPVLSSQCSADPDVFSFLSASRNITRLRNCIYFCIWCIMVSFHISSVWALSCLREHLPLQSSFSCASTKTQQLPWAVIMLLHGGLTRGFWQVFASSFENMPWNLLGSSSGKGERSFLASWCRKTYWQLFTVGMSLAAGGGE